MKPVIAIIGLLCACTSMLFAAEADKPSDARFDGVVPQFIAAWDRKDREKLDDFIDPSLGFWIVYNFGIERKPYHFHSLDEPLGQGEHGFGYLGVAGFGDCEPKMGSPPTCDKEGQLRGYCRFGRTEPTFLAAFDARVLAGAEESEDLARFRREREAVKRAAGETVYFLSDQRWGAVFYFARSGNRWTLLVIDTSECSA